MYALVARCEELDRAMQPVPALAKRIRDMKGTLERLEGLCKTSVGSDYGNPFSDEGKFLPLKTMLGPRYDDQVAEENRFHPSMLSNYLKSLKVKMGLLVDLTNTTRFYDRNDIEKEGIKYIKLQCKGHGECPTPENTETFIRVCEHFSDKNPSELIGVSSYIHLTSILNFYC
ncbi:hypothetical protein llap_16533 [Limosa lapponica baueri]|uniref:BLOC-1-related complex subunit 6 C-terminal helix domain-containing protein n=1 Tax=Limosa lapponica baueri TaxID=1758121 RepID=A0A2I0TH94_LIMLA|nr:hypothetical protein llap_16533 [Limosa lapponica baueri]